MIRALALAALLALSACAAAGDGLYGRLLGGRVAGDASHASISGADGAADALPLAIAHCTRFGRDAQYTGREGGKVVFRCVPKSAPTAR